MLLLFPFQFGLNAFRLLLITLDQQKHRILHSDEMVTGLSLHCRDPELVLVVGYPQGIRFPSVGLILHIPAASR